MRRLDSVRRSWFCLLIMVLAALPQSSSAAEFRSLRVAFGGIGRVGHSVPITATLSDLPASSTCVLKVTSSDPHGDLLVDTVAEAVSDPQGNVVLSGFFRVGRLEGVLQVSVHDESGTSLAEHQMAVAERTVDAEGAATRAKAASEQPSEVDSVLFLLRHSAHCLLTVGEIAGVGAMQSEIQQAYGRDIHFAALNVRTLQELPDDRQGYESVDVLLLTDEFSISDAQHKAIREWVLTGGHLLVSSGSTVEAFLQSPTGKWLQPQFDILAKPVSIRELSSIQNYVSGAVQLQTLSRSVPMARVNSTQLRVIVNSLEGPVIARLGIGGGTVTYVAVDLNKRPLDNWRSLDKLYTMLVFDRLIDSSSQSVRRGNRISSSGASDLSTQLATSADAIPAAKRWSSWQIMVLIVIYLLIIGPLDYLMVVYLLKMPHLTWVTFPLLATAACFFVFYNYDSKVPEFTQQQIHILDVAEADGGQFAFARTLSSVSSAETRRADITAIPRSEALPGAKLESSVLSWTGRAEDVYGGMYREGGAGLGRQLYRRNRLPDQQMFSFVGLPMLAGGSHSFRQETLLEINGPMLFESKLTVSGTGLLEGDVITRLPVPINNWTVLFGSRVYQPVPDATEEQKQILPGAVWNRRNGSVRASDLKSWLNGTRIVSSAKPTAKGGIKGDSMQVTTPYNPRGTDPLEIVTMVSLYDFAGGEAYVGLHNDTLRSMEVSDTIRMNYALLLGQIDEPLADFRIDENVVSPEKSVTVVRVLLPVSRQKAAPAASIEKQAATSEDLPEQIVPPVGKDSVKE